MRDSREKFHTLRQKLQEQALNHHQPEDLLQVEHFDNQFHIQLINIHDLKQSIKQHDRVIQLELAGRGTSISPQTLARHENLQQAYEDLRDTLHDLQDDFAHFCARA